MRFICFGGRFIGSFKKIHQGIKTRLNYHDVACAEFCYKPYHVHNKNSLNYKHPEGSPSYACRCRVLHGKAESAVFEIWKLRTLGRRICVVRSTDCSDSAESTVAAAGAPSNALAHCPPVRRNEGLRLAAFWLTGIPVLRALILLYTILSFWIACRLAQLCPPRLRSRRAPRLAPAVSGVPASPTNPPCFDSPPLGGCGLVGAAFLPRQLRRRPLPPPPLPCIFTFVPPPLLSRHPPPSRLPPRPPTPDLRPGLLILSVDSVRRFWPPAGCSRRWPEPTPAAPSLPAASTRSPSGGRPPSGPAGAGRISGQNRRSSCRTMWHGWTSWSIWRSTSPALWRGWPLPHVLPILPLLHILPLLPILPVLLLLPQSCQCDREEGSLPPARPHPNARPDAHPKARLQPNPM